MSRFLRSWLAWDSVRGLVIGTGAVMILALACFYLLPFGAGIGVAIAAFAFGFIVTLLSSGSVRFQGAGAPPPPASQQVQGPSAPSGDIAAAVEDLFEGLPVALVRISPEGIVSQSNRAARQLLGLGRDERVGLETLVEGLGRSVPGWLSVARDTAEPIKPEMVQPSRRKGEAVLQVALMPSASERDRGLIGVLTDATELKTLEAQFVQSQKMQAIGQLAGGVAHDFNNLLTAISGYCDLLLLRHDRDDPDYADLVQISQNTNRAASLVAHLLAFSRKQTLQPSLLDVNDVVSDMGHLLNRLLGEKWSMGVFYGKQLPRAYVDARQLEQVIMNLVLNARDAMPGGGEVRLETGVIDLDTRQTIDGALVPRGTYVTIEILDSGHGIPDAIRAKIFDPFFSTKEEGQGTGLGLSMVYGIIKQTGGFIFCESDVGKGTRFRVMLPAQEGEETGESREMPVRAPATELGGMRVLLVEDEAPVRNFAARALRMHGVQVIEADSAEAALELVEDRDRHFDIVVSDVVMPGLDGPGWVRKARALRPELEVIFVSGYAEEDFATSYPAITGAEFLPKPFTLKELVAKVRELAARIPPR